MLRRSRNLRDGYPDLGVRACVRTLAPLNLDLFHGKVWRTNVKSMVCDESQRYCVYYRSVTQLLSEELGDSGDFFTEIWLAFV
jgi:hypothetical protein